MIIKFKFPDKFTDEVVGSEITTHNNKDDNQWAEICPRKKVIKRAAFYDYSNVVGDCIKDAIVDHVLIVARNEYNPWDTDIDKHCDSWNQMYRYH